MSAYGGNDTHTRYKTERLTQQRKVQDEGMRQHGGTSGLFSFILHIETISIND